MLPKHVIAAIKSTSTWSVDSHLAPDYLCVVEPLPGMAMHYKTDETHLHVQVSASPKLLYSPKLH